MPSSVLSRARVAALLPPDLKGVAWDELLFNSKAELDAQDGDELHLSVTPDRLDLLSEGGLGYYLQGVSGHATGRPHPRTSSGGPEPAIRVDPSVEPLRPAIGAVVVRSPTQDGLDAGLLAEAIRFQELLHATLGRDRRAASLGIYPLDRLAPPVRYGLEPIASVAFVPLDATEELSGPAFFRDHPMAARYGALGRSGESCLTLRDDHGEILSLPPILNGRSVGEARVGDRALLLESTGTQGRTVREMVGLLLLPFVARGWSLAPVPIEGPGPRRDDGRSLIEPRAIDVPTGLLPAIGGFPYGAGEVEHRLARARLGVRAHAGGVTVEVPPWRPDLLTAVDVAEDVVLIDGLRAEDGSVPPSRTRGRRLPIVALRRTVREWLLGLGFAAPNTPVLIADATVARLGGPPPIRLDHPVSAEYAYARERLLGAHVQVLERNTRHRYPQRFAEVAPVIVRAPAAESGGETRYHAGAVIASESAGFADAAALVDYLLRRLDVGAVREPAEIPGTIPGRAARARVAGESVAEMGELHPRLLTAIGVPVPVAWAEVDLTALAPLLGRPASA